MIEHYYRMRLLSKGCAGFLKGLSKMALGCALQPQRCHLVEHAPLRSGFMIIFQKFSPAHL